MHYYYFSFGLCSFLLTLVVLRIVAGQFEGHLSERSLYIGDIHVHHWIIGIILIVIALLFEKYMGFSIPIQILKGIGFGLFFDGVMFYRDWFQFYDNYRNLK